MDKLSSRKSQINMIRLAELIRLEFVLVSMICNCKKCQYVWEQLGFTDQNGIPIDSNYTCPRCGAINGLSIKERIQEQYKKMGLEEPKFYD